MHKDSIWTSNFILLCLSSFFFFMSFNMILPDIFNFLSDLGGEDYKGWVLFIFTFTAGVSRPLSGRISDKIGRIPVILFGALVSGLGSLAYMFIPGISGLLAGLSPVLIFFIIRLFHGLSTGFKPTGTAAMIADLIPAEKRGQALGWFGFAGSMGMGIGPSLGAQLKLWIGYDGLFIASAMVALLSALVVLWIPETLAKEQQEKWSWDIFNFQLADFYEPAVSRPTLVFLLYAISFGTIFTLLPDMQQYLGFQNKGTFFTIHIIITAVTRVLSGSLSDQYGRLIMVRIGFIVLFVALLLLSFADTKALVICGAVLYGITHGTTTPAIYAWVTDVANPKHRGRAFSTMYIGMEMGIGFGALGAAYLYNNQPEWFSRAFLAALLFGVLGFVLSFSRKNPAQE